MSTEHKIKTCDKCGHEVPGRHFEDLTEIDVAFEALSEAAQAGLRALPPDAVQGILPSRFAAGLPWHNYSAKRGNAPEYVDRIIYRQSPDWVDKRNWPPRPTDEWLAGRRDLQWPHGVRIVGDAPRLAKKRELYVWCDEQRGIAPDGIYAAGCDHSAPDNPHWIVEPIPEPIPEPVGRWVECDVIARGGGAWMVCCDHIPSFHASMIHLSKAISRVGYGGILYSWFEGYEPVPRIDGVSVPIKVRFWIVGA